MPERTLRRLTAATLVLIAVASAGRASYAAETYVGFAYARAGTSILYSEEHYLRAVDGTPQQLVLYRCPDGAAFARKILRDSPGSASPDFDFVDERTGYREGVTTIGHDRSVYVQRDRGVPVESRPLEPRDGAIVDAGFDTYVRTHWDALSERESRIPFVLPSRLGTIDVRLGDSSDAIEHGLPIRRLRMRLDSWYGFAAPSIELSYSTTDRRLLRFIGIGSVRDRGGRNQDVRIEFPTPPRPVADAAADDAEAAPLNGRCDG